MIWRSRSLSARSSKSIVFSRPGSSGRAGAGAVTNGLDHALQALAIVLLNCTTLFCSARHSGHRDLPRRVNAAPIEPFEQGGELRCREPHDPVLDLGPAELALFQPLGDENHARAVPEHELDPVGRLRVIVHLSCQIPGSLSVLTSCKALKFFGRRAITSRTPICTVSVASAATGTCQGAEGMICWAGSTPWGFSRWTEPTQMPSRCAVASTLIVSSRATVGSKGAIPSRSRSALTRTIVQDCPSGLRHRIRFIVTASSRSGHCPPSLRMTSTAFGA